MLSFDYSSGKIVVKKKIIHDVPPQLWGQEGVPDRLGCGVKHEIPNPSEL
jgi:hypothetical protein